MAAKAQHKFVYTQSDGQNKSAEGGSSSLTAVGQVQRLREQRDGENDEYVEDGRAEAAGDGHLGAGGAARHALRVVRLLLVPPPRQHVRRKAIRHLPAQHTVVQSPWWAKPPNIADTTEPDRSSQLAKRRRRASQMAAGEASYAVAPREGGEPDHREGNVEEEPHRLEQAHRLFGQQVDPREAPAATSTPARQSSLVGALADQRTTARLQNERSRRDLKMRAQNQSSKSKLQVSSE